MVTIAWWRQTVRLASDQQDAQTNSCCQHEKHGISWPWTRCPSSSARQCRNGEPCTKPLAGRGSGQWRGARRRMPVPGRLLVTVADTDQNRLAPRPAQNLKAGRQVSAHETHRNGHRRKGEARRRTRGRRRAVRGRRGGLSSRRPGHHKIRFAATALGTYQPIAPIEN